MPGIQCIKHAIAESITQPRCVLIGPYAAAYPVYMRSNACHKTSAVWQFQTVEASRVKFIQFLIAPDG